MEDKPELSVIIVNWNTCELLKECLMTLERSAEGVSTEIIVIDNASSDNSVEEIKRDFGHVLLIENPVNFGFARANNLGIRRAKGNFLLLLNTDSFLQGDSLKKLLLYLNDHEDVGVVHPVLLDANGQVQLSAALRPPSLLTTLFSGGRFFETWKERIPFLKPILPPFSLPLKESTRTQQIFFAPFCCLLVRREMFDLVGLLDENMFVYYEDWDWCFRLHKAKQKIFLVAEASVKHLGGQSTSGQSELYTELQLSSAIYFFRKHFGPFHSLLFVTSMIVSAMIKLPFLLLLRILSKNTYYDGRRHYQTNVLRFFLYPARKRVSPSKDTSGRGVAGEAKK